ncbi:MAG: group III truncated hemoglobin [Cyanobacteria bacterium P01_F01_bin.53]
MPISTLPDLDNPEKIAALVKTFYARVAEDDLLGPIFIEHATVDWDEHTQKLTAFWCAIAFGTTFGASGYHGSPVRKHSAISAVTPFKVEHFTRWVQLFHNTIDRGWSGPYVDFIKSRAVTIAKAQSRNVLNAEPWDNQHLPEQHLSARCPR